MTKAPLPARGEVWLTALDTVPAPDEASCQPALIVSVDAFVPTGAGLVIVLPLTCRQQQIRSHVEVPAAETGLAAPAYILCEEVRSISLARLQRRLGVVAAGSLAAVETRLRFLLGL
jgi:mRNA interferase MazF